MPHAYAKEQKKTLSEKGSAIKRSRHFIVALESVYSKVATFILCPGSQLSLHKAE
jgi:hypothetical protein